MKEVITVYFLKWFLYIKRNEKWFLKAKKSLTIQDSNLTLLAPR